MRLMFFRRAYFWPDDYRKSIFDIDFEGLSRQGVDVLFLDIDNTLVPYDRAVPDETTSAFLASLVVRGFRIVLISNNHRERVAAFAAAAGLPAVADARKPFRGGFRRAAAIVGNPAPGRIALVGDQLMTDVYGAKRMGYRAIVVDALKRKTEKWYTRINRRLEAMALADLRTADPAAFARLHLEEKR